MGNPNTHFSCFGPSGRDHDSSNQYYLSSEIPRLQRIQDISESCFPILGDFEMVGKRETNNPEKVGAEKSRRSVQYFVEHLENRIHVSQKTGNG